MSGVTTIEFDMIHNFKDRRQIPDWVTTNQRKSKLYQTMELCRDMPHKLISANILLIFVSGLDKGEKVIQMIALKTKELPHISG